MVRFGSEICRLRMHDFKIVQRILQIVQTDKSLATQCDFRFNLFFSFSFPVIFSFSFVLVFIIFSF